MSEATTTATCIVCKRAGLDEHEPQTCIRCLGRTRSALASIVELYALLPAAISAKAGAAPPLDPSGVRADHEPPMPGGDALALLAGGSDVNRASRGGDRSHVTDEIGVDATSTVNVLATWEDDFRHLRGEPAATRRADVTSASDYLTRRLSWAAQHHPAFDEFARDIRRLRGRLAVATSHDHVVDRGAKIGCPDCGEPLVRYYRQPDPCPPDCAHDGDGHDQGGRTESWYCPDRQCGRIVDKREYWFAVMATYQQQAS